MEAERLKLVQKTMDEVMQKPAESAKLFDDRLFQTEPSLRDLFKSDINIQARKFVATLAHLVNILDKPAHIEGLARVLGVEHADYGVEEEHYDTVRDALLWCLAEVLDEDFTPLVGAAWGEAYDEIATIMKQATT